MKALEILKNGISFMMIHKDLNPQSREYLESEISQYEEAIKELEAPKTCDGCRNIGKLIDICCDCSRMWSDKFEPKDKL